MTEIVTGILQDTTFFKILQSTPSLDLRDERGKELNLPVFLIGLLVALLHHKDGNLSRIYRSMKNKHTALLLALYIHNERVVSLIHLAVLLKKTLYPYIESQAFVVTPNHIHAVLEIVETSPDMPLQPPPKIKSLSELIGAYKTTSSKQIHLAGLAKFRWQRSFYGHIISTNEAYNNIVNYIQTNPQRLQNDKFYE